MRFAAVILLGLISGCIVQLAEAAIFPIAFNIINAIINAQRSAHNHRELLNGFKALTISTRNLQANVLSQLRNIPDNDGVQNLIRWELTVDQMEDLIIPITSKYDRFRSYQENRDSIERHTLEDFATETVSHRPQSLQSTMYSLRNLVLGRSTSSTSRRKRFVHKAGLFRELKSLLEKLPNMICRLNKTPQQLAYGLYETLVEALMKNYSMIQFSYTLLRLFDKGDFQSESRFTADKYKETLLAVKGEANAVMKELSQWYYRCDPSEHTRGVTFEQVTGLSQGYFVHEPLVSGAEESCKGKCHHYMANPQEDVCDNNPSAMIGFTTGSIWDAYKTATCPTYQNVCTGTLRDCNFVSDKLTICPGKRSSGRRYDWVDLENGERLGPSDRCNDHTHSLSTWLIWFVHCRYCFCYCVEERNSARSFSLRPAVADISDNKIVTGVRFVKENDVFQIQIQQGTADKLGLVKPTTVEWKRVSNRRSAGDEEFKVYMHKRSVDLGTLSAKSGFVITGVSFVSTPLAHLGLKIQVTRIERSTGRLLLDSAEWIMSSLDSPRELRFGDDLPTRDGSINTWKRPSATFLRFTSSSMKKDAAQSTLPFIDLQPVAPRPAVWLRRMGFDFWGDTDTNGGFLSPYVGTVSVYDGDD